MNLTARLTDLMANAAGRWQMTACGVTRSASAIPVLLPHTIAPPRPNAIRVLLIGGLSGRPADVEVALRVVERYGADAAHHSTISLIVLPCGNPDGLALGVAPDNGAGGNPTVGYPPVGNFYHDPHNPEARYLWRWVTYQAPDLVWEIQAGESVRWEASAPLLQQLPHLGITLQPAPLPPDASLLAALAGDAPDLPAPIPGLRLTCPGDAVETASRHLWSTLARVGIGQRSAARQVLEDRVARSPATVAQRLAATYGHQLDPVVYTQGVAISGRLRLTTLQTADPDPVPALVALVAPYVAGARDPFSDQAGGANLAGLVWADELAAATGDSRYVDLLVSTADRYTATHANGVPAPADPDYRVEDMFFTGAMLGRAFQVTGDTRYLSILTRFLLQAQVQQPDGLFRHARSTPYNWGRGNGFAALGFAETLTYLPAKHPDRATLLAMHRRHLDALLRYQQPSGLWRQVIDFSGSYEELSATCMIGYALARGLRLGWLDASYQESLRRAWQGVAARIDDNGGLVDVCTGTGAQQSLRAYLDRPAISGLDERGGALALWFAVELAQREVARNEPASC
ncbi:MAG: glycoside hydrolase family 88 protein [Caldilineaceae bacterium]